MNLQIYCEGCSFQTVDQEEADRHKAISRHSIIIMRPGESTPETHTHYCQVCAGLWDCDDPSCTGPDIWACDKHEKKTGGEIKWKIQSSLN
jgi:hypothetical protein